MANSRSLEFLNGIATTSSEHLDAKYKILNDTERDALITGKQIKLGFQLHHVLDNVIYYLKSYPTEGSITGVVWEQIIDLAHLNSVISGVNTDISNHLNDTSNPHSVTKTQVGLSNVDNTSDANKPVSTAQATAIGVVQSDIDTHEARTDNPHSVTKTQVGLGNVDNTSDLNKPISTLTQSALDLKFDKAGGQVIGNVTVTGDLFVDGDVTQVNGQINAEDSVVLLNDGEVGGGVTLGYSGFDIDRGTGENFWFGFDEVRDRFTVGKIASLSTSEIATTQVLATRADSLTDQSLVKWDDTAGQFVDSGKLITDLDNLAYTNVDNNFSVGQTIGGVVKLATSSNRGELQFGSVNTNYQIFGGDYWGYLRYNAPIHRFDIANSQILRIESTGVDITGALDVTGDIYLSDSSILNLGDSDDLKIFHDGTNARIDNETGDLYIRNFANDKDVRIQSDNGSGSLADYFFADGSSGEAKMYYYGAQRLSTSSLGVEVSGNLDVTGLITASSGVTIPDFGSGNYLGLGTSNDMIMYHDGSDTYFQNTSGVLFFLNNSQHRFLVSGTERFRVDSEGVDVTGTVTATQFIGDGSQLTNLAQASLPSNVALKNIDNDFSVGQSITGALSVNSANINLSNAFFLTARNNADTLNLALISRNTSDNVSIDPDGYGTVFGGTLSTKAIQGDFTNTGYNSIIRASASTAMHVHQFGSGAIANFWYGGAGTVGTGNLVLAVNQDGIDVTGNLDVTGAGSFGVNISAPEFIGTGAAPIILKSSGAGQATGIHFQDNATGKWRIYKETNNNLYIYNANLGSFPLEINTNNDSFSLRGYTGITGNLNVTGTGGFGDTLQVNKVSPALGAQIIISSTTDDNSLKDSRIASRHYSNSEQAIALISGRSDTSTSRVLIGGGRSELNSATQLEFYTATNNITTSGTLRYKIDTTGHNTWTSGGTFGGTVKITNTVQNARVLNLVQTVSSISSDSYTLDVDSSSHVSNMTAAGAFRVKVSSGDAYKINGNGYNTWANGGEFGGTVSGSDGTSSNHFTTLSQVQGLVGASDTLQEVTDNGNVTTNGATFGGLTNLNSFAVVRVNSISSSNSFTNQPTLWIDSAGASDLYPAFGISTNEANVFQISNAGNGSITGNYSVGGNLTITNGSSPSLIIQETGQEQYQILAAGSGLFFKNDGDNQFFLEQGGDSGFYKTDASVGWYFESTNGFVGIGTGATTPTAMLQVAGTGTFGEDLQVGNQSKLSVFLDRVLTVGSSTAGKQGGIELVGNSTVDTVVSALTFNNTQSLSSDKRIAQITSSRDGDNSIGRLDMTLWTGQDATVTPLSLRTYGADVTGNLDVTGTVTSNEFIFGNGQNYSITDEGVGNGIVFNNAAKTRTLGIDLDDASGFLQLSTSRSGYVFDKSVEAIGSVTAETFTATAGNISLDTASTTFGGVFFNDGANSGAIIYDHPTDTMNFRAGFVSDMLSISSTGVSITGTVISSGAYIQGQKIYVKGANTGLDSDGTSLYLKAGSTTYLNTGNTAHVSNTGTITATQFIGDGSQLTNLNVNAIDLSAYARLDGADFTGDITTTQSGGFGTDTPLYTLHSNGRFIITDSGASVTDSEGMEFGYNTTSDEGFFFTRKKDSTSSTYRKLLLRASEFAFSQGDVTIEDNLDVTGTSNLVGKTLMTYNSGIKGSGVGSANTSYISFFETNGTTRQGYIGFPSGANNNLSIVNEVSSKSLSLKDDGVLAYDGNLDATGTVTATEGIFNGNLSLIASVPTLNVTSTNASSGFRINVIGLDQDTDNLLRILDNGTIRHTFYRGGDISFGGAVTATAFRSNASSTDYNLLTRNNSGAALYVQTVPATGVIAQFRYGSATAGAGTLAMKVSNTGVDIASNLDVTGTATASELNVINTSGANLFLNSNTGAVKSGVYLTESGTKTQQGAYISYDGSANLFSIATGNSTLTDRLTIARDSGDVGIASNLNVTGTGTFGGDVQIQNGALSRWYSDSGVTQVAYLNPTSTGTDLYLAGNNHIRLDSRDGSGLFAGTATATSFIKSGGTSSQFLKADGSVDSTNYNPSIGTNADINVISGATVLSYVEITNGVILSHSTRTLTLANLGYTGATNANYITNNNQLTNGAGYLTTASLSSYAKHDTVQSYSKQQYFATGNLTETASIAWNLDNSQVADVYLTDDRILANPTNLESGGFYSIMVLQNGTGNNTLSYGTLYEFGDDGAPTLSTGANKADLLTFWSDGTRMFFTGIKKGFSNYTLSVG